MCSSPKSTRQQDILCLGMAKVQAAATAKGSKRAVDQKAARPTVNPPPAHRAGYMGGILSIQTQVSGGLPTLTSIMFNRTSMMCSSPKSTRQQDILCLGMAKVQAAATAGGGHCKRIKKGRRSKGRKTHCQSAQPERLLP